MSYTLLQLVDQVSGELGLAQPAIVVGSTTNQTLQLLALVTRLGRDLVREFEWQYLTKIYVFQTTAAVATTGTTTNASAVITAIPSTASLAVGNVVTGTGMPSYAEILTVDSSTQVTLNMPATASGTGVALTFAKQDYALPSDFSRMVSDTNWDRTNHWRNLGTKSSQEWSWLQGGVISTGPRERFRIYGNNIRIFSALTSVYTFAFEYVSFNWIIASGGTAGTKSTFTVDSDTMVFPDPLMMAGLKLYFLKAKKLDFGVELAEFTQMLAACKAQDVPVPSLSLSPTLQPELIGPWSIQDGNWPTSSS